MVIILLYPSPPPQTHTHKLTHTLTHSLTEGVPSQNGDFVPEILDFVFTPAMTKPCRNVFIFDDVLVERTEQFTVQVRFVDLKMSLKLAVDVYNLP